MTPKQFTTGASITCFILLFMTALACAAIDPFSLFGFWKKPGWNEKKFSYFMREAIIKPYQIRQYNPDIVLLGNSVANTGFPLDSPLLAGHRVYSMGMAGMGIYGNYRVLQSLKPNQKIIWLLDFWNFLDTNQGNIPSQIDDNDFGKRLPVTREGHRNNLQTWQKIRDAGLTLLSWDALLESWQTVREQDKQGWHLLPDGSWGGQPLHTGKSEQKSFQYMEKIFLNDLKRSTLSSSPYTAGEPYPSLAAMESALNWIYSRHYEVTILIPPCHARWYEILFMTDNWPHYQQWKQAIVQLNERLASQYKAPPLKILDFSGYNIYTTEQVSEWKDRQSRIRYFSDGVHFSREVGSLMLERMHNPDAVSGWGVELTGQSVQGQLDDMAQQHYHYIDTQPQQWQNVLQSCQSVYKHQPGSCLDARQQKLRYGN